MTACSIHTHCVVSLLCIGTEQCAASCLDMQGLLLPSLISWLAAPPESSRTHSVGQCLMLGGQLSATQPQVDGSHSFHSAAKDKHRSFLLTVQVLCACA